MVHFLGRMEQDERLSLPNPFTLPSFSYEKWHYMALFDPGMYPTPMWTSL